MKKVLVLLSLLLFTFGGKAQQKANYKLAEKLRNVSFGSLIGKYSMNVFPKQINNTDKFWFEFTTEEGKNFYFVDPVKGEKRLFFNNTDIAQGVSLITRKGYNEKDLRISDIELSKDLTKMTFSMDGRYEFDFKTKKVRAVEKDHSEEDDEVIYSWMTFSPDRKYILYAKDHNLYIRGNKAKGIDTTEIQLTTDGEKYYSFARDSEDDRKDEAETNARWFKDSKHIYVVREDSRKLKDMFVINSLTKRPTLEKYRYEMPGEKDLCQYELWIIDIEKKTANRVPADKWTDQYIQVIQPGEKGDKLFFQRFKRTWDEVDICVVNTETLEVKELIHEVDKPYRDYHMQNTVILNDGKDILFRSERTGWGHYYLYDGEGNFKHAITSGEWVAGPCIEVDTVGRTLYFYALGKDKNIDPYYYTPCRVNIDKPESLTQLTFDNTNHQIHFSKSFDYFVDICERVDMVPRIVLKNRKGKEIMELSKPDIRRALEMGWKAPERFKVKATDGITDLYGVMWKPFDFDSTKVYPIISSVYPGPFYEYVPTQFRLLHDENTRLAQLGFIVIAVGHRGGTPMRGKFYHTYSHDKLRDYPLADDKYAIEQLADRYSFIDVTRVGIYGHSGGGFMSTAAICTYPDFYKAAVSSAGNHDNYIYNHWWGETHNGVTEEKKVIKDSVNGVRTESIFKFNVGTNMELAKHYKGGLLLIHGWMDDNVHPAHTLRMVDALIRENKNFDMIILPTENHGFGGASNIFYEHKMWFHFARILLGDNTGDYYYELRQYEKANR